MKKKLFLYTILFIFLFIVTGCDLENKVYKNNGLKITIPKDLKEAEFEGMTFYLEKDEMYITGSFASYEDLMKLDVTKDSKIEVYINNVVNNNNLDLDIKKNKTNNKEIFYYGTYDDSENDYYNLISFFKNDKGIWIITLACPKEFKYDLKDKFLDYIKTVEFY